MENHEEKGGLSDSTNQKGQSKRSRTFKQTGLGQFLKADNSNQSKKLKLTGSSETKGSQFLKFVEQKGDLFKCGEDESLAHCISEDIRMGKGIAVIFKKKYGGIQELQAQGVRPGGVAVLKRGERLIYYMITKQKYWQKPTYATLKGSLDAMATHCQKNHVTKLSMPRIGCGLDGLQWDKVKNMIRDAFESVDITITVYTL